VDLQPRGGIRWPEGQGARQPLLPLKLLAQPLTQSFTQDAGRRQRLVLLIHHP
jgi:hypothetical protein